MALAAIHRQFLFIASLVRKFRDQSIQEPAAGGLCEQSPGRGAESETIIPFGHETFLHPDAATEIKRILHALLDTL
jgi:hypothetical protein